MSSSSTDRADGVAPAHRRDFLAVDRGSLVRLGVAVMLGLAALLSPLVGSTAAQFTDSTQVSLTFTVAPTAEPTLTP